MKEKSWWDSIPKSSRVALLSILGFVVLLIVLESWNAVWGAFLGFIGLVDEEPQTKERKERDKVTDSKRGIDEKQQREERKIRKDVSTRKANQKKLQKKDDSLIEERAGSVDEKQRVDDLMEGVDEILGEE